VILLTLGCASGR
jgi:quercetin dioxygenase-like cupin family protein